MRRTHRCRLGVTPYVNVADLAEKERLITAAGGRIHKSKQEVPGMGWFTIFSDPDGNMLALWQPAVKPRTGGDRGSRRKTAAKKTASARMRKKTSRKK